MIAKFHRSEDQSLCSVDVLEYLDATINDDSGRGFGGSLRELSCEETLCDQSLGEIQEVLKANHHNVHLKSLKLPKNSLTSNSAGALAEILNATTETLENLDIRHNDICAKGLQSLLPALTSEDGSLVTLNLYDNRLKREAANSISILLRNNSTIRELHLGRNDLGKNGVKKIAEALLWNTTLEVLTISLNRIGPPGASNIAKNILNNPSTGLVHLDVAANNIGPKGTKSIADMLKFNKTIELLDLSLNHLGVEGAGHLESALKFNTTMIDLRLAGNDITDEGIRAIAQGLKKNKCLKRLSLDFNQLGDDAAEHLGDVLRGDSKLTFLGLSNNVIGSIGATRLAKALSYNLPLAELHLDYNHIGDEGAKCLAKEFIRQNSSLREIKCSNNRMSDIGEFEIMHPVQYRKNLETWLGLLLKRLQKDEVRLVSWWSPDKKKIVADPEVELLAAKLSERMPTRLQCIQLGGQHITGMSVSQLADYLATNPSLSRFYIKDCPRIGSFGVAAIARSLRTNSTLRVLSMIKCGLGEDQEFEGIKALARALQRNSTLEFLSISENGITDEAFKCLLDVIEPSSPRETLPSRCALKCLYVTDNNITDSSMASLQKISTLSELHLDGNQITDRGALDLAKVFTQETSLSLLGVARCQISEKGKGALRLFLPLGISD